MGSIPPTVTPTKEAGKADGFLSLIKARRTYYPLNKTLPIAAERIQTIVSEALQHVPSSFNSQSNRVVVLFGAEHDKLWDITAEILKGIVPAEQWESTGKKMAMFRAAAGTALFFEDQVPIEDLQAKFAIYADRFPTWANHSSAMLQFAVWTALEAEGLGANLQHYNPLIDARIAEEWKLPTTWKLTAQLVFGGKEVADPGEKTFQPLEEKFKVFGA
ncbi:Nitroreductase-like protein [Corynascus similis CBS 632.67]